MSRGAASRIGCLLAVIGVAVATDASARAAAAPVRHHNHAATAPRAPNSAADKAPVRHRNHAATAPRAPISFDPGLAVDLGNPIKLEREAQPPLRPASNVDSRLAPTAARDVFHWSASGHSGSSYRFGSDWSLYAGIADEGQREPGMRRRPGAGFDYRPNEDWNVEFGYVHPYNDGLRGIEPVAPGGSPGGRGEKIHQLLGVSGRIKF